MKSAKLTVLTSKSYVGIRPSQRSLNKISNGIITLSIRKGKTMSTQAALPHKQNECTVNTGIGLLGLDMIKPVDYTSPDANLFNNVRNESGMNVR